MQFNLVATLLAFVSLGVAVPSSHNNDNSALAALEKRCVARYGVCNQDCCSGDKCSFVPLRQENLCVPIDLNEPYNPTCP